MTAASASMASPLWAGFRNICSKAACGGGFEFFGMRVEIGLQVGIGGRDRVGAGIGHELDLLLQPPPDDGVALVEPERQRLANVDLFLHIGVDQPLELVGRGRPLPGLGEDGGKLFDLGRCDDDVVGGALTDGASRP